MVIGIQQLSIFLKLVSALDDDAKQALWAFLIVGVIGYTEF